MLKNGIFCKMVILVVFKGFLMVKNLEILIEIVPVSPIYHYLKKGTKFSLLTDELDLETIDVIIAI